MKIFSINFGHDASFSFFKNGKLIDFFEIERESRLKHHGGITKVMIDHYLSRLGYDIKDIDLLVTSSTQYWCFPHCNSIKIDLGLSIEHEELFGKSQAWEPSNFVRHRQAFETIFGSDGSLKLPKEQMTYYTKMLFDQGLTFSPNHHRRNDCWNAPILEGLGHSLAEVATAYQKLRADKKTINKWKHDFFHPITIKIGSTSIPGMHIDHHAAHAYYASFYTKKPAVIVTHDGGYPEDRFTSSGVYIFRPEFGLLPIAAPKLQLGIIYDKIAGLVQVESAGKLMGLSSYAFPDDDLHALVGLLHKQSKLPSPKETAELIEKMLRIEKVQPRLEALQKFHFHFEDKLRFAQIAANTQKIVSTYFAETIGLLCQQLNECHGDLNNVYITGGFALNCPTNSLLNQNFPELSFHPLPAVGDTGLSLGAGVAVHDLLGIEIEKLHIQNPMSPAFPPSSFNHNTFTKGPRTDYVKLAIDEKVLTIVDKLCAGDIIGVHQGRSEVGPRALGRRSIIALANNEDVRDRINVLKGREPWRPLAPICRFDDFYNYFSGDRDSCLFMMTISSVKSDQIPAVTHVDNSARVQVINEQNSLLFRVLTELHSRGFPPVIINTSFNQANEPIVETLDDALSCAEEIGLDALVTEEGVFNLNLNSSKVDTNPTPFTNAVNTPKPAFTYVSVEDKFREYQKGSKNK